MVPRVIFMSDLSKYIVKGRLTEKEIYLLQRDINIYSQDAFESSITDKSGSNGRIDYGVRNSKIFFVKQEQKKFPNTYNILQSTAIQDYCNINRDIDLSRLASIQYVEYTTGGFFKMHRDYIDNPRYGLSDRRVLTMSINMSSSNDYEGGALAVYNNNKECIATLDRELGSYIIFPAILLHAAKPVLSGERKAIVTWLLDSKTSCEHFFDNIFNHHP